MKRGEMDDEKLELRLGPPGDYHYSCAVKRGFSAIAEPKNEVFKQQDPGFLQLQTKERASGEAEQKLSAAAVQKKRINSAPVVGWPPIRSFRKNLASTSCKPTPESKDVSLEKAAKIESKSTGLFVKINMDGVPIGRKVDLKAYDSYEKLSLGVDELFRCLLAAQRVPSPSGTPRRVDEGKAITGLLDGSGEYTLVYEDDEGDRMLVGDVPWDMFIFTVKRLRVLKSSELTAASLGTISRKKIAVKCSS